jgi:hypothetical protein
MKLMLLSGALVALAFGLVGCLWGAIFPGRGYDRLTWACFYGLGFGVGGFFYGVAIGFALVCLRDWQKKDADQSHRPLDRQPLDDSGLR